jgi:hypothetical protein
MGQQRLRLIVCAGADLLPKLLQLRLQRCRCINRRGGRDEWSGFELGRATVALVKPDGQGTGHFQAAKCIGCGPDVLVNCGVADPLEVKKEVRDFTGKNRPQLQGP